MRRRSPERPLVLQFGPALGSHGGMAAVIEGYAALPLQRYRFAFLATWHLTAPLWGAPLLARALLVLLWRRMTSPPVAVHVHLAERGSLLREGSVVRVARWLGLPVVLSLHGADFIPFLRRYRRLCRSVLRRADVVACLGPDMAAAVRPELAPSTALVLLHNTTALPEAHTAAGEQPPRALFAGLVGRRKGADLLLRAWPMVRARVPDAELVVAGPVVDVPAVDSPGVRFVGDLPREQVWKHMDRSRLVVLPSRADVMPMTLMEAMARARPVVSTPVGEIPELVIDGGVLVPVENVDALTDALVDLLSDPGRSTDLGRRGRQVIADGFAPPRGAAALEALYDDARSRRR